MLWHLRKQFGGAGGKLAVRDLCVRIESGEVFGFLGTNGAAHTRSISLVRAVYAELEPYMPR